jgi:hypothetical protein
VTLTYFPEPRPVDGQFSAALGDLLSLAGLGDTEREAIDQRARRLKGLAPQTDPNWSGVTGVSQVMVAAMRYDVDKLADYLQAHAEEPLLAE